MYSVLVSCNDSVLNGPRPNIHIPSTLGEFDDLVCNRTVYKSILPQTVRDEIYLTGYDREVMAA